MTLSKPNFIAAIAPLVKIAAGSKRTTLPVLCSLKLSASDGLLTVRATDLELDAIETVPCEGDLAPCCVMADKLFNFCRGGGETLQLEIVKDSLRLKTGNATTVLGLLDVTTFAPERTEKTIEQGVNVADLSRAISQVVWACSKTAQDGAGGRPVKNCVDVVCSSNEIAARAFDGYTVASCEIKSISADFGFLLNYSFAKPVCDALLRDEAQFHLCDKYLLVKHKSGSVSAPLSNFARLQFENALNTPVTDAGKLPRARVLEAVRQCGTLADQVSDRIKLSFGEKLRVETAFASPNSHQDEIESENRAFEIHIGAGRLAEALSAFETEALEISEAAALGKILLRGGDLRVLVATMKE